MQHEEFLENPKANTQIAARLNRRGLIAKAELATQLSVVGSRGKDFFFLSTGAEVLRPGLGRSPTVVGTVGGEGSPRLPGARTPSFCHI